MTFLCSPLQTKQSAHRNTFLTVSGLHRGLQAQPHRDPVETGNAHFHPQLQRVKIISYIKKK